jgi:hypothetical protein
MARMFSQGYHLLRDDEAVECASEHRIKRFSQEVQIYRILTILLFGLNVVLISLYLASSTQSSSRHTLVYCESPSSPWTAIALTE